MPPPDWSTSSLAHEAGTSPAELSALGAHLRSCRALSGRLLTLRCGGDVLHGFFAARIVTTIVTVALLIGGAAATF